VRLAPKTPHYHGAMSESFRVHLRSLPDFPADLPDFDPDSAPADPVELFRLWLDEALAAGVPQPHACSLATADSTGQPSARMLILKNIDDDGWPFRDVPHLAEGPGTGREPPGRIEFLLAGAGPPGEGCRRGG
jgi:pyridoxamine 5'-phosphate oxidase